MMSLVSYCALLAYLGWCFISIVHGETYFTKPMHEISENEMFVSFSESSEFIVSSSSPGLQLQENDYLTHADSVRMFSGGLSEFLQSGEEEAIVPVVDTDIVQNDGNKLLGFVMIKPIQPRKILFRRGEVVWDLAEGGELPSLALGNVVITADGAFSKDGKPFGNPPTGGGKCISGRDCFMYNGTCAKGICACKPMRTGTFCQLFQSDISEINKRVREAQRQALLAEATGSNKVANEKPSEDLAAPAASQAKAASSTIKFSRNGSPKATGSDSSDSIKPIEESSNSVQDSPTSSSDESAVKPKKKMKPGAKKRKPKPNSDDANNEEGNSANNAQSNDSSDEEPRERNHAEEKRALQGQLEEKQRQQQRQMLEEQEEEERQRRNEKPPEVPLEDFYGPGKPYPEPYLAGKVPNNVAYARFESRSKGLKFIYSVRFRSGPFGMSFDNKIQDGSMVERVTPGQGAQLSDIQIGDYLVAINHFNMTGAPPKIAQRMMTSLGFPMILVFEARGTTVDPAILMEEIKKRTLNVTIVYPPTLASDFQIRLAEWAPTLNVLDKHYCNVFYIRTAKDQYGCQVESGEFNLTDPVKDIIEKQGVVDAETEAQAPMLTMLIREGTKRAINMPIKSATMGKRGLCTFVERATNAAANGADLSIVVNTDDKLADMPQGKEQLTGCTVPAGIIKDTDGNLLHMAAMTNEVIAVITDSRQEKTPMCSRVIELAEDITDRWAHSVPFVGASMVLSTAPKTKKRGISDEGGRMALSGENGWAFFDYHLAMFGPPVVPLGAMRFILANPPFGCDPNTYTVRISGAAVGILRGGGCSFGIKAINAQKLGAKAVVFLNTDDKATMRLMALPDEVPLINIPCIMVSRRLQFYVEEQLQPFYQLNQHLIAMQPTGIFGEYEARNTLVLPQRLPGQ